MPRMITEKTARPADAGSWAGAPGNTQIALTVTARVLGRGFYKNIKTAEVAAPVLLVGFRCTGTADFLRFKINLLVFQKGFLLRVPL